MAPPTLTDDEISSLFDELARDGLVTRENVEIKLHTVALEHEPRLSDYYMHSPLKGLDGLDVNGFLNTLFPNNTKALDWTEFSKLAKEWEIPTQKRGSSDKNSSQTADPTVSKIDKIKAYIALEAPQIIFMSIVVALQILFAACNFAHFMENHEARHALGWGVIVAKTAAGAIYPTIFFMILSMSRWLATFARKIPGLRHFINWDLYRGFHIYMCCTCLLFATIHAIGHLCGDFVWASRQSHNAAVEHMWGSKYYHSDYVTFLDLLPGWSGIIAFGIFWIIFITALPVVRKRFFEVFQLAHLLLFPFIGFLCAHGTLALLQPPMLGYWLAFPALVVILERLHRFVMGFYPLPATASFLDKNTVTLTIRRRWGRPWHYSAGQYVLLQVPSVSRWQWHPFTISSCDADRITLHIRTDGDWTKKLSKLTGQCFGAGIDGPFGAPAQQIYKFDRAIVVGSGIGVTPMSSIASNYVQQMQRRKDPWRRPRVQNPFARIYTPLTTAKNSPASSLQSSRNTSTVSLANDDRRIDNGRSDVDLEKGEDDAKSTYMIPNHLRRTDFHWITRDPKSLKWFSDYLNRAQAAAQASSSKSELDLAAASLPVPEPPNYASESQAPPIRSQLDLRVNTYVTAPSPSISTHVLRHLLDRYRSSSQLVSGLTGLTNDSIFGKPDFDRVLQDFHEEMKDQGWTGGRVGVFFCGSPAIGASLREACKRQTDRSRGDGSKIGYMFISEVF